MALCTVLTQRGDGGGGLRPLQEWGCPGWWWWAGWGDTTDAASALDALGKLQLLGCDFGGPRDCHSD